MIGFPDDCKQTIPRYNCGLVLNERRTPRTHSLLRSTDGNHRPEPQRKLALARCVASFRAPASFCYTIGLVPLARSPLAYFKDRLTFGGLVAVGDLRTSCREACPISDFPCIVAFS